MRGPRPPNPNMRPAYQGSNPVSDVWAKHALSIVSKYLKRLENHFHTVKKFMNDLSLLSVYWGLNDRPKGNSEFCLHETLKEGREETKLTVSLGTTHEVYCYASYLKNRKKLWRIRVLLGRLAHTFATVWRSMTWSRANAVESSICGFPREFTVHLRELVSFDPPIGKLSSLFLSFYSLLSNKYFNKLDMPTGS